MIAKRPSVFIYTNRPDSAVLKEICAGIEENGVFYEIFADNLMPDITVLGMEP